jgi:Kelch motif
VRLARHGLLLAASLLITAQTVWAAEKPTGTWTEASQTGDIGFGTAVTSLADGSVLVSGGTSQSGAVASVQTWDPKTNSWKSDQPMPTGRAAQSSTLLLDGSVLIAGGWLDQPNPLATALLYLPGGGAANAPPMSTSRYDHTATRLNDGRVLVAGGYGRTITGEPPPRLQSTEIYDPTSHTWRLGPPLSTSRAGQQALPLRDGRVLVLGGSESVSVTGEIYDPKTDRWLTIAPPEMQGTGFAIALLADGRVLAAGGALFQRGPITSIRTARIYDPQANVWSAAPDMLSGGTGIGIPLRDGRVLVLQNDLSHARAPLFAEMYDPSTDSWAAPAPSPKTLAATATGVLLPHDRVLIFDQSVTMLFDPTRSPSSPSPKPLESPQSTPILALVALLLLLILGVQAL